MSYARCGRAMKWSVILGTAAAIGMVNACSSTPGSGKIRVNPFPGTGIEGEWEVQGPKTTLPNGWSPGSEQSINVRVNGKNYQIRLCIATNPANPTCVYINLGNCGDTFGWQMYCETTVAEQRGDGTAALRHCPPEWGTVEYDDQTGIAYVSFTMECGDESMVTSLVGGVTMTAPGGVPLDPFDFETTYGGIIPDDTYVEIVGSLDCVLWNCFRFERDTISFADTGTGVVVDVAIRRVHGAPPVAMVGLDGVLSESVVVHKPQ